MGAFFITAYTIEQFIIKIDFLRSMALPFFYVANLDTKSIVLDEDTSKHVILVLRMKRGEELLLTDGKGKKVIAHIVDENRKRCMVEIGSTQMDAPPKRKVTVGISIIKNASRFEWFLEKATEIGVNEIYPLICERTEKEKFRFDRMQNILVSAMLQSQQTWLPQLHEPTIFGNVLTAGGYAQKFIAHCVEGDKKSLSDYFSNEHNTSTLVLIGPEGDFTSTEISQALSNDFIPVAMGDTRLRTETAGIVAATLLCIAH
jgi:16S rRNA (uracil1498-N3)-methyltransferase